MMKFQHKPTISKHGEIKNRNERIVSLSQTSVFLRNLDTLTLQSNFGCSRPLVYHGLSWTIIDYHGLSWTIMIMTAYPQPNPDPLGSKNIAIHHIGAVFGSFLKFWYPGAIF